MTTTSMTVRDKAVSLREFLFEKKRMETFEEALPKWLSVERLLRVVFSSALKNPRILDCTKESILNAVMGCATLGLEPILGRAYLIPYNNNKQIGGKWQKVLECQFQVGYQGLIDLARRSGTISDIIGYNVYQNDEFDISFGMNPDIKHRPWYMLPAYQKEGPGEIIGAYCVWTLKDGTKHPEFMPIYDIHKRRDVSQAYQADVKYKKKDSPWLKWPEDMNLKTVIKHSSKMVPASIEFMQAVEYDNDSEMGKMGINHFLARGMGAGPGLTDDDSQTPPSNTEAFDAIIREKGLDKDRV
ncbi:MAG: recombinase RecT, partial [Deltaproteobacteria bacterium]|nr:recombinase RecT [Deltaproteobacteria bacterium]